jgi:hypothetical protein
MTDLRSRLPALILLLGLYQHCPSALAADRVVYGFQVAYGLENAIPRNISHINMLYVQPQIGIAVWDNPETRLPLQRFEVLSEGIIGGSPHPGGHMFGDTLLFRFVFKPVRHWTPILDFSSGPMHTTINENASELGGHVQFLSQGGVGLKRSFRPGLGYVIEWRYFHMSNAGLTTPNHGFNGNMLTVGLRWSKARP